FNLADGTDSDGTPTSWNTIIKNVLSGGSAGVEAERMKVNGASCDWFSVKKAKRIASMAQVLETVGKIEQLKTIHDLNQVSKMEKNSEAIADFMEDKGNREILEHNSDNLDWYLNRTESSLKLYKYHYLIDEFLPSNG
ncbi:MAG: hypothetical protein AAFO95_19850, partial [Cyanobacteria bacterium J06600_6]